MDNEIRKERAAFITIFVILTACALAIVVLGNGLSFTGFAVNDAGGAGSLIGKEDALSAIKEAEGVIARMAENNFSITYVNDTIIEAKRVFEQVRYAEVLRNSSSGYLERKEAEAALKLIDWQNLTYSNILIYAERVEDREKEAFLIVDSISATEQEIKGYEDMGIEAGEERGMLSQAKTAFYEDRYEDSKNLLRGVTDSLEKKAGELTSLKALNRATKSFFQKYWVNIIVIFVLLGIVILIGYKRISRWLLEKKVRMFKAEEKAIIELMKETQRERYNSGKMPEMVYRLRMVKYEEKLNRIRRTLPVMESRLKKHRH